MFEILVIVGCATFFYRIGEHDYGKGAWTCAASITLSILTSVFFHFMFAPLIANAALYVALLIYNLLRKEPQGTQGGL